MHKCTGTPCTLIHAILTTSQTCPFHISSLSNQSDHISFASKNLTISSLFLNTNITPKPPTYLIIADPKPDADIQVRNDTRKSKFLTLPIIAQSFHC
ncbi:hypothetical protein HanRHA438_Chr02g0050661 [Helianthus annuus]|nr:hypothetical protein HanRHA438_Chr02g0050661 [Helianthus annuus]